MKTVPCPQCKKPVDLSQKTAFRPFCSERCRLIDLGAWASEDYQISGQSASEAFGDPELDGEDSGDWDLSRLH